MDSIERNIEAAREIVSYVSHMFTPEQLFAFAQTVYSSKGCENLHTPYTVLCIANLIIERIESGVICNPQEDSSNV